MSVRGLITYAFCFFHCICFFSRHHCYQLIRQLICTGRTDGSLSCALHVTAPTPQSGQTWRPVLHGTIKNHRINCIFVIKMSVLKLITLLPQKLFQRGPANSPLQFDFRQLIQMIVTQSKGTICNMVSEHNTCIIEIK